MSTVHRRTGTPLDSGSFMGGTPLKSGSIFSQQNQTGPSSQEVQFLKQQLASSERNLREKEQEAQVLTNEVEILKEKSETMKPKLEKLETDYQHLKESKIALVTNLSIEIDNLKEHLQRLIKRNPHERKSSSALRFFDLSSFFSSGESDDEEEEKFVMDACSNKQITTRYFKSNKKLQEKLLLDALVKHPALRSKLWETLQNQPM